MKSALFPANKLTLSLIAAGLLVAAPAAWAHDNGHDDHGHDDHSHHGHDDHGHDEHGHDDHGHDDHGHDDHGHDEARQLGAHVHGAAQLLVARDHDHVTVILDSPSINVVGFEHYAQTDADREALHVAEELLSNPVNVFGLTAAAQCGLESVHIQSEQLAEMRGEAADQDHGHDDHGHDDHGHDDHGHDDHGHGHDHADGSMHSEFNVQYEFHCDAPDQLAGLQVNAFDTFTGFETVDVQWILDGVQGAQRSLPRRAQVNF